MTVDTFEPTIIGGVHLTWTQSDGSFAAYQIQRMDPYTPWRSIARITDQDVGQFYDWEGRLGVPSTYRLRTVTDIGIASSWSDELVVTACAPECGYTFTSNEAPELNVGYTDMYPGASERTYTFPEAAFPTERAFYGRDYVVRFRPLERGGTRFTRRLLTSGFSSPVRPGPEAFTALRDLAWASLSYVCVRDESGNRWFAGIDVPDGLIHQPGHFSFATVNVVQVTDRPSLPNAIGYDGFRLLEDDGFRLLDDDGFRLLGGDS